MKSKNVTFEQWDGGKTPTSRESPAQLFLCLVCDIRTEMFVSLLPMIFFPMSDIQVHSIVMF